MNARLVLLQVYRQLRFKKKKFKDGMLVKVSYSAIKIINKINLLSSIIDSQTTFRLEV